MASPSTSPRIEFGHGARGERTTVCNSDEELSGPPPTSSKTHGPPDWLRLAPLALVAALTAGGLLARQLPKIPSGYVAPPHAAAILPPRLDLIPARKAPPRPPPLPPFISKADPPLASLDDGKSSLAIGTTTLWGKALTQEEMKERRAMLFSGRGRNRSHSFLANRLGRRLVPKVLGTTARCIAAFVLAPVVNASYAITRYAITRYYGKDGHCLFVSKPFKKTGIDIDKHQTPCADLDEIYSCKTALPNVKNLICHFETAAGKFYDMTSACAISFYGLVTKVLHLLALPCSEMKLSDLQLFIMGHKTFYPYHHIEPPIATTVIPSSTAPMNNYAHSTASLASSDAASSTQAVPVALQVVTGVGAGLTGGHFALIGSAVFSALLLMAIVTLLLRFRRLWFPKLNRCFAL
eukprot:GHVT01024323.1.p1 GENE.GHVT01024323.1~~GHVT01024323.1.p1  ORF type:complete len:408 (-),score=37.79 GHVT01024323.1:372-1595(-)